MKLIRVIPVLLVLAALVTVSCSVEQGSPVGPSTSGGEPDGGLVSCDPLPYEVTSQVVGTSGGTLRFGPHRLAIPAGALDRDVRITAEVLAKRVNAVRLRPEGLQFAAGKPAQLTLSYANCSTGSIDPRRVALTTDSLVIVEYVRSTPSPANRKIVGELLHFSRYAVAW